MLDAFTSVLEYKAKVEAIEVVEVEESDTSRTCCVCGRKDDGQRVERGLYVCDEHDDAFNAELNEAENIRLDINESSSESIPDSGRYKKSRLVGTAWSLHILLAQRIPTAGTS